MGRNDPEKEAVMALTARFANLPQYAGLRMGNRFSCNAVGSAVIGLFGESRDILLVMLDDLAKTEYPRLGSHSIPHLSEA